MSPRSTRARAAVGRGDKRAPDEPAALPDSGRRSPLDPPAARSGGSAPRLARVLERVARGELPAGEIARVDAIAERSFEGQRLSFAEELERPWTRAWLARSFEGGGEGRVVAFLVAWHVADELHVLHVATEEEARRRGHGEALMRAAVAYAASSGVRLVLLEVRRRNRAAIKLYRKLGFTALGLRPRYYADGEDAVEMVLQLDPTTGAALPGRDEVRIDAP